MIRLLLILLFASLAPAGFAQQCHLPDRLAAPAPCPDRGRGDGDTAARGQPGDFDFYVLALSWSPAFCEQAKDRAGADLQCRRNRFGFVVHGLWPQYGPGKGDGGKGSSWPQFCTPAAPVAETTLRRALCLMPSERLVQCQWAKHGTCSDQPTPDAYIDKIQRLMAGLTLPDFTKGGSRTVAEIAEAFITANQARGLTSAHIRLDLGRDGRLEEVRICYEKKLNQFQACGETVGGFDPADRRESGKRVLIRAVAPS